MAIIIFVISPYMTITEKKYQTWEINYDNIILKKKIKIIILCKKKSVLFIV